MTLAQKTLKYSLLYAGIAQLVERNLAKVEVASSRLVSRSKFRKGEALLPLFASLATASLAGWQSGYAAACKAVYAGSIPTPASKSSLLLDSVC